MKWEHFGYVFFFVANFHILATEINKIRTFFGGVFFVTNFHILATERNDNGNFFKKHILFFLLRKRFAIFSFTKNLKI